MANMPGVWEVFRHHSLLTNDDGYHRRALEFIRGTGLDPAKIKPEWVIIRRGNLTELHVSEYVFAASGRYTMDYARNEPVTVPVIVPLGPASAPQAWPEPESRGAGDALAGA